MATTPDLQEDELVELYAWVDSIPLSRPKKNIARDFADGVLAAEIVHHYFPKLVELHNYPSASNSKQKLINWTTLNHRVFRKLGFNLPTHSCESVAFGESGAVERVLKLLRAKLAAYQTKQEVEKARRRDECVDADLTSEGIPFSPEKLGSSTNSPRKKGMLVASYRRRHEVDEDGDLIQSYGRLEESDTLLLREAQEVNRLLEEKVSKLEALLRLKDAKINALIARMEVAGLIYENCDVDDLRRTV